MQRRVYARMYRLCADCRFPATGPVAASALCCRRALSVEYRTGTGRELVEIGGAALWGQELSQPRGGSRLQPSGWDVTPDRQVAGRRGQAGSGQRVDRAELRVVGGNPCHSKTVSVASGQIIL